jgi:hypothetical protein
MSTKERNAKLAAVKLKLAEKYERLAKVARSRPKKKSLSNLSARYRRQAEDLRIRPG